MDIYNIEKIRENLWIINELGATFMYVINGKDRALLLDTGLGLIDLPEIVCRLCGEKAVIVVNTHAHMDHMAGNYRFERVHVGEKDVEAAKHIFNSNDRQELIHYYLSDIQKNGYDLSGYTPGTAKEVMPLKDGDLIQLGDYTLRVIGIPSHTEGSIALLEETQGWLFSGDVMLMWEAWGWLRESASLQQYYESMGRLKAIRNKIKTIFSSHGRADLTMEGCGPYELKPEMIDIYHDGIYMAMTGELQATEFSFSETILGVSYEGEIMKSVKFPSYGGIIYNQ